ncbi:MAG: glycosyltransferase family 2 protein [Fimbriimonadaceae bacterium]|nr:glycosyltransferase family 2 protein [Fimbriimonadaceae bacterium]
MNIVIPMAGAGSRFVVAGYHTPKPFIPIKGKAMIEHVIENVAIPGAKFFLLCRMEHLSHLNETRMMERHDVAFVPVVHPTEGAACTVLLAEKFIDSDEPLIIANSDQWVSYDKEAWQNRLQGLDGAIMTFRANHPKWSYSLEEKGRVVRVAEKQVISDKATVGVYYYRHGADFVWGARQMISNDTRVNGEFYVCPVFNELVETKLIKNFDVEAMYGLGTPEDLQANYDRIAA